MPTITGVFKQSKNGRPAECITLRLSQQATVIATGKQAEEEITVILDGDTIPEETELPGNDELTPEGTYYRFDLRDTKFEPLLSDAAWLRILGESPVDIGNLINEGPAPELVPVVEPAPKRLPARRALPAVPKPGVNYSGFVAGTIYPSASTAPCKLPVIKKGTFGDGGRFGVLKFTLPFKASVSRASILVEMPGSPILVGLYNSAGERVCSTTINASKSDVATGEFGREVFLNQGEYSFVWSAVNNTGLRVYGLAESPLAFEVGNAGGGAIVLGTVDVPSGTSELPEKLGTVVPCSSYTPIMAWFKA